AITDVLRDWPQLRRGSQQRLKGRIASQLVPRADQQPALARQSEECFRFYRRLDERLLDRDMRTGQKRLTRGLEQLRHRGEGRSVGAVREVQRSRFAHVVHSDDDVRSRNPPERLQVIT